MTEHFGISGKIDYYHLPLDDPLGLTWCQFCKETMNSTTIQIHQGALTGITYIQIICGKCKKTVWTAKLGKRRIEKLNKKCTICGNPTSYYNATAIKFHDNKTFYYCSKKCYRKDKNALF
jgi:hypothetical protein